MEIYVKKISDISIFFLCFLVFKHALILLVSQMQTQQMMTSQLRSHIEYLIQTYHILLLILLSKLVNNLAIMAGFNTI